MDTIIFPLNPGMQDEAVADLQDGLRLLLEKGLLKITNADPKVLEEGLRGERTGSLYGEATNQMVRLFQDQHHMHFSGLVVENKLGQAQHSSDSVQTQI